jgi:hypothetical protein
VIDGDAVIHELVLAALAEQVFDMFMMSAAPAYDRADRPPPDSTDRDK